MDELNISHMMIYRGIYAASFEELTDQERKEYPNATLAFQFFTLYPQDRRWRWRVRQRRICAFNTETEQPLYEIEEEMKFALETILDVLILVYEAQPSWVGEVADFLSGITAENMKDISAKLSGKEAEFIYYHTRKYTPMYPACSSTCNEDTAPRIITIANTAYDKFQLHWMMSHGFTMGDIYDAVSLWNQETEDKDNYPFAMFLEDQGFGNGTLWPCFAEFLEAEYLDVPFMKTLLSGKQFLEYLQDIGRLHIQKGEEAAQTPAVKYWSNIDGELHHHGKCLISADQLPVELRPAYESGICGGNLYLCETENGYGVALVYEYNEGMAEDRKCSMDELFECAVADAEKMIMAEINEDCQIYVVERPNGENYHDLIVVFPADTHVDFIRRESGLFGCFAYKAHFENGWLFYGNVKDDGEKIIVPTPIGAIIAARVGGTEYPGVAVDFHPNDGEDYASVVMEYATTYRPHCLGDAPEKRRIVQTRVHRDSNSEPAVLMEMRPGK